MVCWVVAWDCESSCRSPVAVASVRLTVAFAVARKFSLACSCANPKVCTDDGREQVRSWDLRRGTVGRRNKEIGLVGLECSGHVGDEVGDAVRVHGRGALLRGRRRGGLRDRRGEWSDAVRRRWADELDGSLLRILLVVLIHVSRRTRTSRSEIPGHVWKRGKCLQ